MIEADEDLVAWMAEVEQWLRSTGAILERVFWPREIGRAFAITPDLNLRPGEPRHRGVDQIHALIVSRTAALTTMRAELESYSVTPRRWLLSLSGRSITEQVIAAVVVSALGGLVTFLGIRSLAGSQPSTTPSLMPSPSLPAAVPSVSPDQPTISQTSSPIPTVSASPVASGPLYTTDFSDWSGIDDWTVVDVTPSAPVHRRMTKGASSFSRRPRRCPIAMSR